MGRGELVRSLSARRDLAGGRVFGNVGDVFRLSLRSFRWWGVWRRVGLCAFFFSLVYFARL
ncbi:hypothetical protein RBWH47_05590 [Rhodopirellula baltica WH47]|uniref:Uncharacterized protein n=1 Tax=Rhodopirellula baltica WH47 TaxID=991778 RepID=F2ATG0_RHOBT|nr:hypothetical protein RBWH47_05590 [Rhodopirellula baltica WH47]